MANLNPSGFHSNPSYSVLEHAAAVLAEINDVLGSQEQKLQKVFEESQQSRSERIDGLLKAIETCTTDNYMLSVLAKNKETIEKVNKTVWANTDLSKPSSLANNTLQKTKQQIPRVANKS